MNFTFRVLHVCTGNIGRSPMAERFMQLRLAERLGDAASTIEVTSAGTWGCEGSRMETFAETALVECGGDSAGFAARKLTPQILADSDLVLTATREHRGEVVRMHPQSVRRAFTLREFASLAGLEEVLRLAPAVGGSEAQDLGGRTRAMVGVAGRLRGGGQRRDPATDDIDDPLGSPLETYRQLAAEIDAACIRTIDLLLGPLH